MVGNDYKKRNANTEHGNSVEIESGFTIRQPEIFLFDFNSGGGLKVREGRDQRSDKRRDNKQVPQIANKIMNHNEVCVTRNEEGGNSRKHERPNTLDIDVLFLIFRGAF